MLACRARGQQTACWASKRHDILAGQRGGGLRFYPMCKNPSPKPLGRRQTRHCARNPTRHDIRHPLCQTPPTPGGPGPNTPFRCPGAGRHQRPMGHREDNRPVQSMLILRHHAEVPRSCQLLHRGSAAAAGQEVARVQRPVLAALRAARQERARILYEYTPCVQRPKERHSQDCVRVFGHDAAGQVGHDIKVVSTPASILLNLAAAYRGPRPPPRWRGQSTPGTLPCCSLQGAGAGRSHAAPLPSGAASICLDVRRAMVCRRLVFTPNSSKSLPRMIRASYPGFEGSTMFPQSTLSGKGHMAPLGSTYGVSPRAQAEARARPPQAPPERLGWRPLRCSLSPFCHQPDEAVVAAARHVAPAVAIRPDWRQTVRGDKPRQAEVLPRLQDLKPAKSGSICLAVVEAEAWVDTSLRNATMHNQK